MFVPKNIAVKVQYLYLLLRRFNKNVTTIAKKKFVWLA